MAKYKLGPLGYQLLPSTGGDPILQLLHSRLIGKAIEPTTKAAAPPAQPQPAAVKPAPLPAPSSPRPKQESTPTMPSSHTPIADAWENAIQTRMNRGMSRGKATVALVRENPELHAMYIRETNSHRPAAIRMSQFAK